MEIKVENIEKVPRRGILWDELNSETTEGENGGKG